jgi:hypothetical protein
MLAFTAYAVFSRKTAVASLAAGPTRASIYSPYWWFATAQILFAVQDESATVATVATSATLAAVATVTTLTAVSICLAVVAPAAVATLATLAAVAAVAT